MIMIGKMAKKVKTSTKTTFNYQKNVYIVKNFINLLSDLDDAWHNTNDKNYKSRSYF